MNGKRYSTRNHYDLLGVPIGASIQHIKDSYRFLTAKTPMTDIAYRMLTDPSERREYDAMLQKTGLGNTRSQIDFAQDERDWGCRGRERCDCGSLLKTDDDWYCHECWGKFDYYVVFNMLGGHLLHESQMVAVTESAGQSLSQASDDCVVFGPFTKEEAETFLERKNRMRSKPID